ncbi:hypothetical protein CK203_093349 [Vitis vinifera]|uniref:Uncharacterized protein n=1 Tax=Vitis vinifera TaxID=29760 RepID=A0A438F7V5_VITVI|nr:hypothetical protein CK203_093349 [Vitis vinifera]
MEVQTGLGSRMCDDAIKPTLFASFDVRIADFLPILSRGLPARKKGSRGVWRWVLSVSLRSDGFAQESTGCLVRNGDKGSEEAARFQGGNVVVEEGEKQDEVRVGIVTALTSHALFANLPSFPFLLE